MISQTIFPPDIRLEKEIKSLANSGFVIKVLCNQFEREKNPDFKFASIIRIKAIFKNQSWNKLFNFPLFINPRYIYYAIKTAWEFRPDFVHAHDLPMVPLGLIIGWLFKIPIIYDMHENYPEALKSFKKRGMINFLFKNPSAARLLDKIALYFSDRIIVVIEENKQRLIEAGVPQEKIYVIPNYVDTEMFNYQSSSQCNLEEFENKIVILYSGTVSPERDLETAVRAIPHIINDIPGIKLLIIGDGPSVKDLKSLSTNLNITSYVKFIEWPGHENIPGFLKCAKVCIIPQPSNEYINTTIPHKLFEYMHFGKTVIVSDAIPLKRIITSSNAGLVFKSGDPIDLARKIKEAIFSDIPYGKNGIFAVEKKFNWFEASKQLLNLYTSF